MKKERIRQIVFWTSVSVSVLMILLICVEVYKGIKASRDFDDLREIVNNATTTESVSMEESAESTCEPVTEPQATTDGSEETTAPALQETTTTIEETTTQREILDRYKEIHELNNHVVGWIKIEGTVIDYPALEVEGDNDYYLKKDFYGNESKYGQIIFDYRCDYETPSTNIILHGHHMADGTMFGGLMKYKKKSYYKEHKYIQFDTLYEEGEYEIFAVFKSKVYNNVDDVFKYYNFINAESEEEFNEYVKNVKEMSLYDTGVTPVYGDELLALSTCEYSQENGRLVVAARKIKKAETEESTSVTETQEQIKSAN